jgi:hypothetical protein
MTARKQTHNQDSSQKPVSHMRHPGLGIVLRIRGQVTPKTPMSMGFSRSLGASGIRCSIHETADPLALVLSGR